MRRRTGPRRLPTLERPAQVFLSARAAGTAPTTEVRGAAALFGAPLDLTESYRSGTHGGPSAIRRMSEALESYSPLLDRDLEEATLLDLGDLALEGADMEAALEAIADSMAQAASLAKLAIMLGGEHTASLAGFRGIKRRYPDAMLVQVDAHLDIRRQYEGERLTHASWLYQAGEQFGFENIIQVGLRSGTREEWQVSRERTAWGSTELSLPPAVRSAMAPHALYLSIDIDVLDPAFAPGTGCPEPGGVTFRDLAAFVYGLAGLRIVAMDVMEVSPNLDSSEITALAAAKLVREATLLFGVES